MDGILVSYLIHLGRPAIDSIDSRSTRAAVVQSPTRLATHEVDFLAAEHLGTSFSEMNAVQVPYRLLWIGPERSGVLSPSAAAERQIVYLDLMLPFCPSLS